MATTPEHQTSVVPAQPGFWVHKCEDGEVVSRQMVVAWLVVYAWQPGKWNGRTVAISTEGVCDDFNCFIENPDGTCLDDVGQSFDSVDSATKQVAETWRLVEEDNAAEAIQATA